MAKDSQIGKTLLLALLLFVLMEFVLQVRAQLKFGNSILNAAFADSAQAVSLFVQHDGYQLLVPNIEFAGSSIKVQSNQLGLRSAAIEPKTNGTARVIALGASSTYGAYAATNDDTFPAILQRISTGMPLQVINAGIPGNDIGSQYLLYAGQLAGLSEDVLILYSGLSNDIGRLCQRSSSAKSYALPQLQAPKWLLSVDLLLKNSTNLRYVPYKYSPMPDLSPYLQQYAASLRQIVELAQQRQVKTILLAENLRSFRSEQPLQLQQQLAASALYYTPCLTVGQFSEVFEQYNRVQQQVAAEFTGVHYVSLSEQVPGGSEYFTDSVHFSAKGEQAIAAALAQVLKNTQQVAP
ncbi:SGNH/GDSL hydrolase family protein [Rheinheimera oceanensis]|uniref:SGNH/GDSL hydrolase family protein n=1 Tax=Rheinheimera oceanensis TaxID=2817449 RepID=UPI001BFD3D64|nr:SGNH/GDSL hydrolase family protein [Rheinheimera oceanensis]